MITQASKMQCSIQFQNTIKQIFHQPKMITPVNDFNYDPSSDEDSAPFVGKYHSVLRRRKNQNSSEIQKQTKQYKKKLFSYKNMVNLYQHWRLQRPFIEKHVFNLQNILAINEESMRNPESDESFLSTKFYMKKVKKVTIHRDALLFDLENVQQCITPIPYICQRFKSYGDSKFYEMAETIAQMEETLAEINQRLLNEGTYNNTELQVFLGEMSAKSYFSQYSPNLLIISNKLLELLGYDKEVFAIESIKYKSILYEFFSAEHYMNVIYKHLENINLLRSFLDREMCLDQFCRKSLIIYNDFVYNRSNKKIKCQFFAGTSKQLTPYIQIKQIGNDQQELRILTDQQQKRKQKIIQFKQAHHSSEFKVLNNMISIPKHLDPAYHQKICTYRMLQSLMDTQSPSSQ